VIASEALQRLGVTTSRILSLIETAEGLWRGDEPSPTRTTVMVRLARTHLRFGTCKRLLFLRQPAQLEPFVVEARTAAGRMAGLAGRPVGLEPRHHRRPAPTTPRAGTENTQAAVLVRWNLPETPLRPVIERIGAAIDEWDDRTPLQDWLALTAASEAPEGG
jgi:hypothetical protein